MLAAPESTRAGAPPALVWIVDDSVLQGELGRRALADLYDVQVFNDGATMLEDLSAGGDPDLLVLDWHMPNISGFELCQFVRETRDAASLPILILTASGGDNLAKAFSAGANDFVRKPYARTELDARVAGLVRSKQIHVRLAEAEQRLRIEGEFRERFIGMLAHDLRQPLNTFLFANESIAHAVANGLNVDALLTIQGRTANRMTRMVSELLDFTRSRPEAGMPLERRLMDLGPLARGVIEEMRVGHPARSFRLKVQGPCAGCWDRDRLAQICSNLIGNAIEHSSSPSSPIDVGLEEHPAHVELAVSNEGTPIPANLLPGLFEPFRRGHEASRVGGGLGLGLYIVQEIVRAHGGSVMAESDLRATVFRVSLPIDSARAHASA